MKTTQIVLTMYPEGMPSVANFSFEEVTLPALKEGEVLLKPLFISVDPYMRGRMSIARSYIAPFQLNKPIEGGVVAVVEDSKSDLLKKGDKVLGMLPWATHSIEKGDRLRKIGVEKISDSYYLGILGMPGLTAYFGLMDICKPKKGETVVVSGAAGAVGLTVGQLAKMQGCRVVGIAGSDAKAQLLTKEYGYDVVINYKTEKNLDKAIAAACPTGIDCYFDNVGGHITDNVMQHFNYHARMALCGQISCYNQVKEEKGPRILPLFLTRSVLVQGYIVGDYQSRFLEGLAYLTHGVKEGKLKYTETVIDGFDHLPEAFLGLFDGSNVGKMVVRI